MNILQLSKHYPPIFGGLEIVAEFMSRACVEGGHSVSVLSTGPIRSTYSGKYGETVHQCHEDVKLNSSPFSFGYYSQVKKHLREGVVDVILVHLPNPFAHEICKFFSKEIREKKIKLIGVYHSDIINQVLLRDAYNLHFKNHLDLYDCFICSSPNLKNSSSILKNLPDSKVRVIPFCIEPIERNSSHRSEFRGKFLAIGRLVPYKGFGFLVDAFRDLPFELTIVGDGPLRDELKARASKNVTFMSQVSEDDKFTLLKNSDALMMSSINRSEAYGMTIVEAFSVGLPVIASSIDTGVSYLVKHEETGLKFGILNKSELIEQVTRFSRDRELRQRLSKQCMHFFDLSLSYQAFSENMLSLLKSLH